MRIRSRGRECALQMFYQLELTGLSSKEVYDQFFLEYEEPYPLKEFAFFLLTGAFERRDMLDGCIQRYARNWDLKRMAVIDRNILRIAIFELLYVEDIPAKVTINEAVELAKRFGDVDSAKFVNGILDSVFRKEQPSAAQIKSPS